MRLTVVGLVRLPGAVVAPSTFNSLASCHPLRPCDSPVPTIMSWSSWLFAALCQCPRRRARWQHQCSQIAPQLQPGRRHQTAPAGTCGHLRTQPCPVPGAGGVRSHFNHLMTNVVTNSKLECVTGRLPLVYPALMYGVVLHHMHTIGLLSSRQLPHLYGDSWPPWQPRLRPTRRTPEAAAGWITYLGGAGLGPPVPATPANADVTQGDTRMDTTATR